ncbi:CPBP family intramembrane glutamic endopeptidase [Haloferax larsenii]|uniref:CPBP family intramembrane glutamic endopeptidase n=1 Tax=Haloferax larsenii TaxID=302484 RepID=UPI002811E4E3|nr:CPBP family intramembrane glutamic endopeptidase [Haloferax larsenii]
MSGHRRCRSDSVAPRTGCSNLISNRTSLQPSTDCVGVHELTGNVWLAAAVPLVVFTAIHVPLWGVGATLQIGAWSVVVTAVYLWRRTLVAPIIMHLLNDIVGFVIPSAMG